MRRPGITVLVFAGALALAAGGAACGGGGRGGSDGGAGDAAVRSGSGSSTVISDGEADAPTAASVPEVAVPHALRFAAPLVGGGQVDMTSHAGRPVLLWFWAPF